MSREWTSCIARAMRTCDLFSSLYFSSSGGNSSLGGKTKRASRESVSNFPHRRKHDQSCPGQRGPSRPRPYHPILSRPFQFMIPFSPFLFKSSSPLSSLSMIMNFVISLFFYILFFFSSNVRLFERCMCNVMNWQSLSQFSRDGIVSNKTVKTVAIKSVFFIRIFKIISERVWRFSLRRVLAKKWKSIFAIFKNSGR